MPPLSGILHTYSLKHGALTIFESGDCSSSSCLLFIAGLTEGYMGTPYVQKLSSKLQAINWSFCQLHMQSSYMGFGTGSLARDFEDISAAIGYLLENGKHRVVLMGHSTGCQNSVHYVLNHSNTNNSSSVSGVILQAPVSDREFIKFKLGNAKWEEYVFLVSRMIKEGKSDEPVPREYWEYVGGAPCSAYRFASLASPGGDDDFFSSDLPQDRLDEIWGHPAWNHAPVIVLYSGDDQYVPAYVDKRSMLQKWDRIYRSRINESLPRESLFEILPNANHEIDDAGLKIFCVEY